MRWSKGSQRVFDGGAVGHNTVNVFTAEKPPDSSFYVYDFEDAAGGPKPPPRQTVQPEPAAPKEQTPPPIEIIKAEAPPGIPADEVARREQEAFERGRQEGLQASDARISQLTEQLEGAMQFFHDTLNKTEERTSRQTLELAVIVAEQLFRKAIEVDADKLVATVSELIQEADNNSSIRVVVDPATAKQWRSHDETLRTLLGERPFEVESKDDLSLGDIIVHAGELTLDERIANRVQQYAQRLEQELGFGTTD